METQTTSSFSCTTICGICSGDVQCGDDVLYVFDFKDGVETSDLEGEIDMDDLWPESFLVTRVNLLTGTELISPARTTPSIGMCEHEPREPETIDLY